jgi:hypothetical protein
MNWDSVQKLTHIHRANLFGQGTNACNEEKENLLDKDAGTSK